MKKLIAVIMLFCITLCACGKGSSEPVSTSSSTNIPSETEKAEISLTETPCDICHKTGNCKPYESKKWNLSKSDYDTTVFYICENCWDTVMMNEEEIENYNKLVEALNVIISDTKAQTYFKNKTINVDISNTGIHIEPDDWLENRLKECLGDNCMSDIKSINSYTIKVKNGSQVIKASAPQSILYPEDNPILQKQQKDEELEAAWKELEEAINGNNF